MRDAGLEQLPVHAVAGFRPAAAEGDVAPSHRLGVLLGLALAPLLASTVSAFWQCLSYAALEHAFWKSAEFWFFHTGLVLWLICLAGLQGRMLHMAYVFGHEWTHALAALACGGRLLRVPVVSASGGHVVTDRTNLFIRLAPYVVPFYSVLAGTAFGLAGLLRPLPEQALWAFYGVLGYTWAFHATFTIRMMRIRQPDFAILGRFFSVVVIGLANLLLLCLLLVLASPNVTLNTFWRVWLEQANGMAVALYQAFGGR